jgi:hypothetical protein
MQNPESPKPINSEEQVIQPQQTEPVALTPAEQKAEDNLIKVVTEAYKGDLEGRTDRAVKALDKVIFGDQEEDRQFLLAIEETLKGQDQEEDPTVRINRALKMIADHLWPPEQQDLDKRLFSEDDEPT